LQIMRSWKFDRGVNKYAFKGLLRRIPPAKSKKVMKTSALPMHLILNLPGLKFQTDKS
jgi:hypothetical protein